jgi:hypothetical protein
MSLEDRRRFAEIGGWRQFEKGRMLVDGQCAERSPIIPEAPVLFCRDCGIEIDKNDVDANLNTWGVFKGYCSDDIEHHVED